MDRETIIRNLAYSYTNAPYGYVVNTAKKAGIGTMSWTELCHALAEHTYNDWKADNEQTWLGNESGTMEDYAVTTAGYEGVREDGTSANPYGIQTASGWCIYEHVLPAVLRRFFRKNADYGDNHRNGLGLRAEYVGLHRKLEKLRRAIWDGQLMAGESAEEMLEDLIGQCLIMLDLLKFEGGEVDDAGGV